MEVCYDETTKTWSTRPLTVRTAAATLRERVFNILRKILARFKSFLKLD
jgi:hypothetical protein